MPSCATSGKSNVRGTTSVGSSYGKSVLRWRRRAAAGVPYCLLLLFLCVTVGEWARLTLRCCLRVLIAHLFDDDLRARPRRFELMPARAECCFWGGRRLGARARFFLFLRKREVASVSPQRQVCALEFGRLRQVRSGWQEVSRQLIVHKSSLG